MIKLSFDGHRCFKADARGHQITIDVPPEKGGEDRGMMPSEILTVSLAACVGITMVGWLEKNNLKTDGLEVSAQMGMALTPRRLETVKLKINYNQPISAEQIEQLQQAFSSCPVMASLKYSPKVEINF